MRQEEELQRRIRIWGRGGIVAYAIVDKCDYERLNKHTWRRDKDGYAIRNVKVNGKARTIYLHREVLGLEHGDPLHCDHIDHNRLNNTRANLRTCTPQQNWRNQSIHNNNTSGYRGASWHKPSNKWQALARVSGRPKVWLGYYRDKLAAAYAHELFVSLVTPAAEFENPQWPEGPIGQDELEKARVQAHAKAEKFLREVRASGGDADDVND